MRSVNRTLALIELFAERGAALTLSEAARALEIPVSTCFNLIKSLQSTGYLYEVGAKSFYPTVRLLQKAQAISAHDPARITIRPELERLRDQCGETVLWTKQAGHQVILLEVVISTHTIKYTATVGDFRPIYNSASGKAILSTYAEPQRAQLAAKLKMPGSTPKSIRDPAKLLRDVKLGMRRGWFSTNGEGVVDVMSIARPIEIGGSVYAVSIVGPVNRLEKVMPQQAVMLVSCCERITELFRRR